MLRRWRDLKLRVIVVVDTPNEKEEAKSRYAREAASPARPRARPQAGPNNRHQIAHEIKIIRFFLPAYRSILELLADVRIVGAIVVVRNASVRAEA